MTCLKFNIETGHEEHYCLDCKHQEQIKTGCTKCHTSGTWTENETVCGFERIEE